MDPVKVTIWLLSTVLQVNPIDIIGERIGSYESSHWYAYSYVTHQVRVTNLKVRI